MRLKGKVSIITGAGQGIGRATAIKFAKEGAKVAACDINVAAAEETAKLITDAGGESVHFRVDVTDKETIARMVEGVMAKWGRIDTLVNNAGVFVSKPFTDYTAEDYAMVVGVNLTGFFWLTQRVIAEMVTRYGGHVVNISATLAEVANSHVPEVLAALTKGGLASATRSLAVEYASRGIRVNAVSPGIIQTPMHPAESYDGLGDELPPLGRVGQVSDVVDGILFLEASPYITGEILHIDGGQIAGH
jgi:NAD(P)-dependent dehydrogenase (short-subunit alcohol dehydrogenase family)